MSWYSAMPMGLPIPESFEVVGVFQRGGGELGLRRGQVSLEIGDSPALPEVKPAFDVAVESRARPTFVGLPLEEVFADGMIERDEFLIDRERGPLACGGDAGFEAFQSVAVAGGKDRVGAHGKGFFKGGCPACCHGWMSSFAGCVFLFVFEVSGINNSVPRWRRWWFPSQLGCTCRWWLEGMPGAWLRRWAGSGW